MNNLDVILNMEKFIASERFPSPPSKDIHLELLSYLQQGADQSIVSEEYLELIHKRILSYFGATAKTDEQYNKEAVILNGEFWNILHDKMKNNPALAQLMMRDGSHSRYFASFAVDIAKGDLGLAVLAAQFVGHSVLGDLEVIPPSDGAFYYCATESSFTMTRFRAAEMQRAFNGAAKILFLGGGLDPSIWTRGFSPQNGQKFVMYDRMDLTAYWNQLLGRSLSDVGIDYRVSDMARAFEDTAQLDYYECICLSGVASYYSDPEQLAKLLGGAKRLLTQGGKIVFDLQVAHEVYAFDVRVLGWPTTMKIEPSVEKAIEKVRAVCEQVGLEYIEETQEVGKAPAGIVFWTKKK